MFQFNVSYVTTTTKTYFLVRKPKILVNLTLVGLGPGLGSLKQVHNQEVVVSKPLGWNVLVITYRMDVG